MASDEVTKTQELLAILQTRPWTKGERASARQQISRYYQRKLASLQHALFEVIAPDHGEKPDPFEIDTYIHRYHKQSANPLLGKQPPLYRFFLNPYQDMHCTKCPQCAAKCTSGKCCWSSILNRTVSSRSIRHAAIIHTVIC